MLMPRKRTWRNRFMIKRDCRAANYAQLIANGSHLPDVSSPPPQRLRTSSPLCLGWWERKKQELSSQKGSDKRRQVASLCIWCCHTPQSAKMDRHNLGLDVGEGTTMRFGWCKNQKDFYTYQTELVVMGTVLSPCWKVCEYGLKTDSIKLNLLISHVKEEHFEPSL